MPSIDLSAACAPCALQISVGRLWVAKSSVVTLGLVCPRVDLNDILDTLQQAILHAMLIRSHGVWY
jgi:hypothetical protein